MRRFLEVLAVVAALTLPHPVTAQAIGSGEEPPSAELAKAIEFVRATGASKNLQVIAFRMAQVSQTMAILASAHGPLFVPVLQRNLGVASAKRQEEWDRNLARAHLKFFSTDELSSILQLRQQSPEFEKFMKHRDDVGSEMQATSFPIAAEVAADALGLTVKEMGLGGE